jgi:hypothetical protein
MNGKGLKRDMDMKWRGLRFAFLACLVTLSTGCGGGGGGEEPDSGDVYTGLPGAQKVQMHLHGLSNHNAARMPGSMQWHSALAIETNAANVLWWTDHHAVFDQSADTSVEFADGIVRAEDLAFFVSEILARPPPDFAPGPDELSSFKAFVSGGTPFAQIEPTGLLFGLTTDSGEEWREYKYLSRDQALKKIHSTSFSRPLPSGVALDLEFVPGEQSADTQYELHVDLAWHRVDGISLQHRLVYQFVPPSDPESVEVVNNSDVVVRVPTNDSGRYSLDLLDAASHLINGDDNTVSQLSFRLAGRRGVVVSALLRSLNLRSSAPEPENQIQAITSIAKRYEQSYGLGGPVGLETGLSDFQHIYVLMEGTKAVPLHLNAFLPYDLRSGTILEPINGDGGLARWVDNVHAVRGLVSLNHPYGVNYRAEPLLDETSRIQLTRMVAELLLNSSAYGADLLEVGYIERGQMGLRDHLRLWDVLTANGVYMYGTGVSDSHGDPWANGPFDNPFITWILSERMDPASLADELRVGRAFFGNPFLWDGAFDFSVGGLRMGRRAFYAQDQAKLLVNLDPWPEEASLHVVQGIISGGLNPAYLHDRTVLSKGQQLIVSTVQPSFVRLELYIGDEPVLFSNPVILLRQ